MKNVKIFPYIILSFAIILIGAQSAFAAKKLKIVTTIPDLADIAARVGGERVEVEALAKGYQDPHYVDAKPSLILKLKRADMFIQIGLDLEIGWAPSLLETARNRKIYYGGKGYVNAAEGIELLEIPQGDPAKLRAQGDIHVWGNPHFWLNPQNAKVIATNIQKRLISVSPDDAEYFRKNLDVFNAQIDSADAAWKKKFAPYKNVEIIAYHNSWPYFAKHFDINIAGFIEPKPGIPPTPSQLLSVIKTMKDTRIKVIIISPYFDDKPANSVANQVGAEVVPFAPSVGAFKQVESYFDLFDHNINALIAAFKRNGTMPTE
ncbi:MAG: metal ABC transporter substrate-binding protein [bacterium]